MTMFGGMLRTCSDVRHVSGLKKNLICLGTLDTFGCRIICEGGFMKDARWLLFVMKGKMNENLYSLEGSTITGLANVSTNTMSDHDTKLLALEAWSHG